MHLKSVRTNAVIAGSVVVLVCVFQILSRQSSIKDVYLSSQSPPMITMVVSNPTWRAFEIVGSASDCDCVRAQKFPLTVPSFSSTNVRFQVADSSMDSTKRIRLFTLPPTSHLVGECWVPGVTSPVLLPQPDAAFQ